MRKLKAEGKYHFVMPSAGKNELASSDMSERLLCADCEARLSNWEGHASDLYSAWLAFQGPKLPRRAKVDYRKAKLFMLSIAWRSAIATGPFYQGTVIEPAVCEDLRRRIMTGSPGGDLDYPVTATLEKSGTLKRGLSTPRTSILTQGNKSYPLFSVFAGGFYFDVILRTQLTELEPLSRLRESGYWAAVEFMIHHTQDQNFMAAADFAGWKAPGE